MSYRIKTVAQMVNVPRATLLAWERRYGVVQPVRHENGYRAYSESDVETLRSVKALVDQGLKVSEAVARIRQQADAKPASPSLSVGSLYADLKDALMSFDRDRALVYAQNASTVSFAVQLEQVYGPLLCEIGDEWTRGEATISQEHFATNFVRERVTAMLVALNSGPRGGHTVVCAGYSDDPHELPVLFLAVHLALAGFRALPLGILMPEHALAEAVADTGARMVTVTATAPRSPAEVEAYLATLLETLPDNCTVALGGIGVPSGLVETQRLRFPSTAAQLVAIARAELATI